MAYAHTEFAPPRAFTLPRKASPAPARGFFSRLFHAFADANVRRAEHEVARYLESTGGKLTDSAEREIERIYLSHVIR